MTRPHTALVMAKDEMVKDANCFNDVELLAEVLGSKQVSQSEMHAIETMFARLHDRIGQA